MERRTSSSQMGSAHELTPEPRRQHCSTFAHLHEPVVEIFQSRRSFDDCTGAAGGGGGRSSSNDSPETRVILHSKLADLGQSLFETEQPSPMPDFPDPSTLSQISPRTSRVTSGHASGEWKRLRGKPKPLHQSYRNARSSFKASGQLSSRSGGGASASFGQSLGQSLGQSVCLTVERSLRKSTLEEPDAPQEEDEALSKNTKSSVVCFDTPRAAFAELPRTLYRFAGAKRKGLRQQQQQTKREQTTPAVKVPVLAQIDSIVQMRTGTEDPARCYSSGGLSELSARLPRNPTEASVGEMLNSGSVVRLSQAGAILASSAGGSYTTLRRNYEQERDQLEQKIKLIDSMLDGERKERRILVRHPQLRKDVQRY